MKEEKMGIVPVFALSAMAIVGMKYMMCNPTIKKMMKEKAKCATKKLYQKLDEID